MGLTFRLGQLPTSLFTDASNNVGIGAAPSGSYKLEVTGTAKVGSLAIAATGQVFIGTITALFNSQVNINYNQSTYEGLAISTDKIYNGSPQPNLIFGGKYNSAGDYRQFATIQSIKDNTTSGDSAASLVFNTNGNSASPTERMRISSTGVATFSGEIKSGDTITLGAAAVGGFWTWGSTIAYLVAGTGKALNLNPNGASGTTGLSIATSGASTFTTTSGLGVTITTNDVATLKMTNSAGSTKNWGFATTNTVASDFGIYQSTSNGGDPISAGTPRLYFSGTGYTKITNSGALYNSTGPWHEIRQSVADWVAVVSNSNATSPNGLYMEYTASTPNNTGSEFLYCRDATTLRFRLASSGNCYNVTGTYTSGVSDINYKEQIVDANSQWDDIKNLRVVNFKFKNDVAENGENALRQIGFIAQEVEKTSPNLIEEMSDEKTGETWKTIKASIIHTKAIKALQEAMARIEILEERLNKAGL